MRQSPRLSRSAQPPGLKRRPKIGYETSCAAVISANRSAPGLSLKRMIASPVINSSNRDCSSINGQLCSCRNAHHDRRERVTRAESDLLKEAAAEDRQRMGPRRRSAPQETSVPPTTIGSSAALAHESLSVILNTRERLSSARPQQLRPSFLRVRHCRGGNGHLAVSAEVRPR
jgi:hypothetical protein